MMIGIRRSTRDVTDMRPNEIPMYTEQLVYKEEISCSIEAS
jgi:hypothetical protein